MTGWFFFMVYVGGVSANIGQKIGFWDRVFWPALLGAAVLRWPFKQREDAA